MQIHQLKDPVYTSNVYLIQAQRPVLVDTGFGLVDEIPSFVRQHLGANAHLSAIVFTHGHGDHIMGAAELGELFEAPLFIHPDEADRLPGAEAMPSVVDCGDIRFDVIQTPGHSPGGVSLYEPDQQALICGDCVFPGGRTGRWDLPGSNHAALMSAVARLKKLKVRALYPGHYDPVLENVVAHLAASLTTLEVVGDPFDEAAYDRHIATLAI